MEKYCRAGQATDDSMAHAYGMLDTEGYRHTLTICNSYCFSTATMVARTHLNVTSYVHYLSCQCTVLVHSVNVYVIRVQASQPGRLHSDRVVIFGGWRNFSKTAYTDQTCINRNRRLKETVKYCFHTMKRNMCFHKSTAISRVWFFKRRSASAKSIKLNVDMKRATKKNSRDSSVSIATMTWAALSEARIPAGARYFSLLQSVQTGSGAQPRSLQGVKRPRRAAAQSPPSRAWISNVIIV